MGLRSGSPTGRGNGLRGRGLRVRIPPGALARHTANGLFVAIRGHDAPFRVGTACGSSDSRPSTVPTPFALVMSMVSIPVFQTGRAGSNPVQGSTRCRHVTHGFRRHRANGVTAHDGKTNNVRLAVGNPHPVFGGVPKRQRELTVNQRLRLRRFESCRHHETPTVSVVSQDTATSF